jgi:hypothetical protein
MHHNNSISGKFNVIFGTMQKALLKVFEIASKRLYICIKLQAIAKAWIII